MSAKIEARVRHQFTAPAGQVYNAWLNPQAARTWMSESLKSCGQTGEMRRVEIDARVGGKFFFSDLRNGTDACHWGTYLELTRPNEIVFTWIVDQSEEADPSTVRLTIQPEGSGSTATIVHEIDEKWREYVSRTEAGWSRMLQHVDKYLQ